MAQTSFSREIAVALAGTAIGALLYVVGSAYLGGYYRYFYVTLSELNLSLHDVLYHSIFGIYRVLLESLPFVISAFLLWKLALGENFPAGKYPNPYYLVSVGVVVAVFITFYIVNSASDVGYEKAEKDLGEIKRTTAKVYNNSSAAELIGTFNETDPAWEIHYLSSTSEILFLLVTREYTSVRHTLKIPINNETIISIQRGD